MKNKNRTEQLGIEKKSKWNKKQENKLLLLLFLVCALF